MGKARSKAGRSEMPTQIYHRLDRMQLLDTAWPKGKKYKRKRIDWVTCSDTKTHQ